MRDANFRATSRVLSYSDSTPDENTARLIHGDAAASAASANTNAVRTRGDRIASTTSMA